MMHKSGRNDASTPGASTDKTLADYLERKGFFKTVPKNDDAKWPKKKLTFEEWLHHRFPAGVEGHAKMLNLGDLEQCWKAAQENK